MIDWIEKTCPKCGRSEMLSVADAHRELARQGKLKRAKEPEFMLVLELFQLICQQQTCDKCGHRGLEAAEAEPEEDWDLPQVNCQSCGQAIPAERVTLFPDAKLCTQCQQKRERSDADGLDDATPEYCPRCGAIMTLQQSGGSSTTRYIMSCSECNYRGSKGRGSKGRGSKG